MSDTPTQNNVGKISLSDDVLKTSVVYSNIGQEIFVTTKDKIELALRDQHHYIKVKSDWITPAGILLSLLATLVAADFRNSFGLRAEFWQSLFFLLFLASSIWLCITGFRAFKYRNKGDISTFIETLANNMSEDNK